MYGKDLESRERRKAPRVREGEGGWSSPEPWVLASGGRTGQTFTGKGKGKPWILLGETRTLGRVFGVRGKARLKK